MATATKICKVCGAEYPYCHTERRVAGVFRWQDVACSEEHGKQYFEMILASRREDAQKAADEKIESIPSGEDQNPEKVSGKTRKTSAKKAQ